MCDPTSTPVSRPNTNTTPRAWIRTLGHRALDTRVKRVPREQRDQLRLPLEPRPVAVLLDDGHEAPDAADGLGARRVDMVDVVVVQDAQVGRPVVGAAAGGGDRGARGGRRLVVHVGRYVAGMRGGSG